MQNTQLSAFEYYKNNASKPSTSNGKRRLINKRNGKTVKKSSDKLVSESMPPIYTNGTDENSDEFVRPAKVSKSNISNTKSKVDKNKITKSDSESELDHMKTIHIKNRKKASQKSEIKSITIDSSDSVENGRRLFLWVISPVTESKFFNDFWERKPFYVKRSISTYFKYLLSCEEIDSVLRQKKLFFSKNVDVTSYSPTTGQRETHNPPGRATAPQVWDYYSNGCSIRILNPQTYFPKIHSMNATLQEFFGCFVGANVYLTPAGTQGFAPHYDDIEAFVLQIEGTKLWKLYAPRSTGEVLPRESSANLSQDELGSALRTVLLQPGDVLYMPRGLVHQAHAQEETHSLHITLSVYQRNAWADLLEQLLPSALRRAIESDVSFREGLPLHYLHYMGVAHSDKPTAERANFIHKLQNLVSRVMRHLPVDAAVDQLAKRFMHSALPPHLRAHERACTAIGDGEHVQQGHVYNRAEVGLDTRLKLIRYHCLRIVHEEDAVRIYFSVNNSKEYHGEEPQFLEIDESLAPAVDALISHYPNFIAVEDFPIDDNMAKVTIAGDLWENGLLQTEEPLGYTSD